MGDDEFEELARGLTPEMVAKLEQSVQATAAGISGLSSRLGVTTETETKKEDEEE